ncbi:MAG: DUF421 domain-containing protein [Bacteriovoracaceae bacterium]|nr:DUF421 domain-containing protein [Bacteriovoracaceae bacterium]
MNIFHPDLSLLNLAFRAIVVYFSILLLLRISGKRQLGQMGATEFVALLLISNAVQNAMNGGDNSLTGGVVLAVVLIACSVLISFLTYRSSFFSMLFEGTPTLLVHHGKIIKKNLFKERLRESELMALLRKQGVHNLHEISTAILEADGTLSITKI